MLLQRSLVVAAAVSLSSLAWADGIVESAREIPVTDEVDVLVVGGTAAGVAAATAAAEKGATVYLAGGFTYLGEDMAGTLELECATGDGATELERKLRRFEQAYAPYGYDHGPDFRFLGGWQYVGMANDKFANNAEPIGPWDSVFYTNRVSVFCTFAQEERIADVTAVVVENDDPNAFAISTQISCAGSHGMSEVANFRPSMTTTSLLMKSFFSIERVLLMAKKTIRQAMSSKTNMAGCAVVRPSDEEEPATGPFTRRPFLNVTSELVDPLFRWILRCLTLAKSPGASALSPLFLTREFFTSVTSFPNSSCVRPF